MIDYKTWTMKIRILLSITILWFLSLTVSASGNSFYIKNGLLDLELTNIEEIQSIKLQGDWESYWNQLL